MNATQLTPKQAAEKAVAYRNLKEVEAQLGTELDALKAELKAYIEDTGEPISVEGQPDLIIQERSTAWTWDVESLAKNEPTEYARLLSHGGITVNKSVADGLAKAGLVTNTYKRYGTAGSTSALMFRKEKP